MKDGVPLLEVRNVSVSIGDKEIVTGADLTAEAGKLVAIVGPNGAGKSTLARTAAGLRKATSGTVRWAGEDVQKMRARQLALTRAFIPQRARVPVGVTVREAVAIGRAPHLKPLQRPSDHDRDSVDRALARAGVAEFDKRLLTTLSGGELQRVQVAVGLAQDAPALIADEPTSSLDLGAAAAMARLLRQLADDGLAIVLVVHDLALAAAVADTIVVMSCGRTVRAGRPDEVLDADLLAEVWKVDAALETDDAGRTALRVGWLDSFPAHSAGLVPLHRGDDA